MVNYKKLAEEIASHFIDNNVMSVEDYDNILKEIEDNKILTQNILDRYDNEEYWDRTILENKELEGE